MVFSKKWLRNHPKFLLHFLIHINEHMLCRKFELIPTSIFQFMSIKKRANYMLTNTSTCTCTLFLGIPFNTLNLTKNPLYYSNLLFLILSNLCNIYPLY